MIVEILMVEMNRRLFLAGCLATPIVSLAIIKIATPEPRLSVRKYTGPSEGQMEWYRKQLAKIRSLPIDRVIFDEWGFQDSWVDEFECQMYEHRING